jgi:pimeloyl-ACP methyl ester carboxylesterase
MSSLVLVHGAFSNHVTNWELVLPLFEARFAVRAVARRGRGGVPATEGHSVEDEARDVVRVIKAAGAPVFLLGHSYGAHVALAAASMEPARVRKLVLYEPPWPHILTRVAMARLEELAAAEDWDAFAAWFFSELLAVPAEELEALRASEFWPPIVADGPATLGDFRALHRYRFDSADFRNLPMPVLLQTGSESPPELYVTEALNQALPDARVGMLEGQAHEGMTTAPEQYARAVAEFLDEIRTG